MHSRVWLFNLPDQLHSNIPSWYQASLSPPIIMKKVPSSNLTDDTIHVKQLVRTRHMERALPILEETVEKSAEALGDQDRE